MLVCIKKEFSKNTTEVFTKTVFHYVPEILKYIDEIKEPRKNWNYSMRYLIFSEMLMFLSEGRSQRFTETAYEDTKYLTNISKIIRKKVEKVPDAEIYTNVFSRIETKEIKAIKVIYTIIKITHMMLQIMEHSDICGEFNKKYGSVKVFRRKFYAHLSEKGLFIITGCSHTGICNIIEYAKKICKIIEYME